MIQLKAKNEQEAKVEAIKLSLDNPGQYVTTAALFGLFAFMSKQLDVQAPTDSKFKWYVLNGKIKPFTTKQRIADQNATPLMM